MLKAEEGRAHQSRQRDRRIDDDRRLHERWVREFLAAQSNTCVRLHMHVTQEDCLALRSRDEPPIQCIKCPGMGMEERRQRDRRSEEDRRA